MFLQHNTMILLKQCGEGSADDRKFLGLLLIQIFGVNVLKKSSVFGNSAHGKAHTALDAKKLGFIRKLFDLHVGGDPTRTLNFNSIVNRHCNNKRKPY